MLASVQDNSTKNDNQWPATDKSLIDDSLECFYFPLL